MWNRVVLLVAGVAFGWSLVHWASAEPARVRVHLTRSIAALVAGTAMIVWLGSASAAAGLVAGLVFALSALVAYAANAQQVNRVPESEPALPLEPPLERQEGVALLLVLSGAPARYDGPAYWATQFTRQAAEGTRVPHWFVRPWAYGRIRAAYQRMQDRHPVRSATETLLGDLRSRLPRSVHLEAAWVGSAPTLEEQLRGFTQRGLCRIVVIPVGAEPSAEAVQSLVTRSGARGAGAHVETAPLWANLWPLPLGSATIEPLLGAAALTPPPPSEQQVAALLIELQRRLPKPAGQS